MPMDGEVLAEKVNQLEDGDKDGVIELLVTYIYGLDEIADPDVEFALYMIERGKGYNRYE